MSLDVTLTDEQADLVAQSIDVAVWLGNLEDSSLIARRLSHGRRVICGSPAYVVQFGQPATPIDLKQHNCIIYRAKSYDNIWRLTKVGETTAVPVSGNLKSDNSAVLMTSAQCGLGLAVLQEAMVRSAIADGSLVSVPGLSSQLDQHRHWALCCPSGSAQYIAKNARLYRFPREVIS